MWDILQAGQDLCQPLIVKKQRIATGQDDVADLRGGGDIVETGRNLGGTEHQGRGADAVLAGTETAVAGALS